MSEIDEISIQLFEEAKWFLEKGKSILDDNRSKQPYIHAALLLGFSALEAHLNSISEELSMRQGLGVLDMSILTEREFELKNGKFQLTNKLKIYRFEDRLKYIFENFSLERSIEVTKNEWWPNLTGSIDIRNKLVHPKSKVSINEKQVHDALMAILKCLNDIYLCVYKKPFPSFNRGLDSNIF